MATINPTPAGGPKTVDFSGAYRDSTRGMTLKALQQRQRELQEAAVRAAAPRQIGHPLQGVAQIADVIGTSIKEGRAANAEAAGRARFAELLAGGLTQEEIGEAMGLDPETAQKYQDRIWQQEDTASERTYTEGREGVKHGWDVDAATARVQAEKDAAAAAQGATAGLQEDQQTHDLVKQKAQAAIDAKAAIDAAATEAEKAELKVKSDKEQAEFQEKLDRRSAELQSGLDTARAKETAAVESPAAKIQLAINSGLLSPEEGKRQLDALAAANRPKPSEAYTPLQKKVDEEFAPVMAEWEQNGGAGITGQVAQVNEALGILSKPGLLGPTGAVIGNLPEALQTFVNPDGIIARDAIRSVVQSTMKSVLGAQYTQKEGEELLARAFNTALSPEENIRRAQLLLEQITTIAKSKQQLIEFAKANGTTWGYAGPTVNIDALTNLDLGDDEETPPAAGGGDGALVKPAEIPQEEWDNMDDADRRLFQ